MSAVTPFLWFDGNAEEAVNFYKTVFDDVKVDNVQRYGEAGPGTPGSIMALTFEIKGQEFMALNGGPEFKFSPAISFFISCETQDEVDRLWDKLGAGGTIHQCGWLDDKFGITWQVVPANLRDYISGADPKKSASAMRAMMKMIKLDINALRRAYEEG